MAGGIRRKKLGRSKKNILTWKGKKEKEKKEGNEKK